YPRPQLWTQRLISFEAPVAPIIFDGGTRSTLSAAEGGSAPYSGRPCLLCSTKTPIEPNPECHDGDEPVEWVGDQRTKIESNLSDAGGGGCILRKTAGAISR